MDGGCPYKFYRGLSSNNMMTLSAGTGKPAPALRGESMNSALNYYSPAGVESSAPEIIAFGFSADSSSANTAIAEAMEEGGIAGSVTIPDGCWNIAWMVLSEPPTAGQSVVIGADYNNRTVRFAGSPVSNYEDYQSLTAENHVFWFAGNYNDSVPAPFQAKNVNSLSNRQNISMVVYNGTASSSLSADKIVVQSEKMVLSMLSFSKDGVDSYTSPSGESYVEVGGKVFLYVPAGESITPADILVAKKAGYKCTGYSADPSISNYVDGVYTAPASKETVTLTPQFTELSYKNITVSSDHGTVTTDPSGQASPGVTVKVNITPASGYVVRSVSATYGEAATSVEVTGSGNSWSFVMPDGDVTVTVTYERVYSVNVTVTNSEGGTASASPDKNVKPGDTVTLTLAPNRGYAPEITAVYGENAALELEGEGSERTFTMPEGDVTVTVTYTQKNSYQVKITETANGRITATPNPAYPGEEVTLKIEPDTGYYLKSIYYYIEGNDAQRLDPRRQGVTKMTFDMPAGNVVVNAVFEKSDRASFVELAPLYDRPGTNTGVGRYDQYEHHYSDSDDAEGENPIVGTIVLGDPVVVKDDPTSGTYTHYTITAEELRLAAHVENKDEASESFGYFVGIALSPVDGGNSKYLSIRASYRGPADSKDKLGQSTGSYDWKASEDKPLVLYMKVDPNQSENKDYWFGVTWTKQPAAVGPKDVVVNEIIRVTVTADCEPIHHIYEVPDELPAGFDGTAYTDSSLGDVDENGAYQGYTEVLQPEQLGWIVPTNWTWHWVVDGDETKTTTSESFNGDLSSVFTDDKDAKYAKFYDHTFKLVIDEIPTHTVTVTQPANGSITLEPAAEGNKYNFGQTVKVKVTADDGYDVSKLIVNGEDVSAKLYNGEYSFSVTQDTTIAAECVATDDTVIAVNVNGYTASHTGERKWSITLPWNNTLPNDSDSGIRFTLKSGAAATLKGVSGNDRTKTYTYTVGDKEYTVEVTIAERRDFTLTVSVDNKGGFEAGSGVTVNDDGSAKVSESARAELTLKPGFGYALPEFIRVSVGNVILASREYTYNSATGKLTIPADKVTGDVDVTVKTVFGNVPVEVHAGSEDIYLVGYDYVTQTNTQTYNPVYNTELPRTASGDNGIQTVTAQ